MFTLTDNVIFSATDLINYLGCRHATFLDLSDLGQLTIVGEPDPTAELLKRKGIEHEQRYLASLKERLNRITIIDPRSTITQRIEQTRAAMADGAEVIYQGALLDMPWMGHADFLVRVDGKTRLGSYGYEVVDTKLARTPQPKHVVQLCVYSRLLARVQEQLPANVHLVLGDSTRVSLPLSHFLHYAELAQRRLERFTATPPRESFGEPCGHCAYCHWIDCCTDGWERIDHLSLVANITRSQIARLCDAGVSTVRKLSELPRTASIPRISAETVA